MMIECGRSSSRRRRGPSPRLAPRLARRSTRRGRSGAGGGAGGRRRRRRRRRCCSRRGSPRTISGADGRRRSPRGGGIGGRTRRPWHGGGGEGAGRVVRLIDGVLCFLFFRPLPEDKYEENITYWESTNIICNLLQVPPTRSM